jgi:hypothetical protein
MTAQLQFRPEVASAQCPCAFVAGISAFPLRSLRLGGFSGVSLFSAPQRRRERRGSAERDQIIVDAALAQDNRQIQDSPVSRQG